VGLARVVVVDDEPSFIKLVTYNLRARGYQVADAANGLDGIERVKESSPDLVILDIRMPGLDGFEVCSYIREISDAAIIMLTAHGAEGDKIRALDRGADDYMTKPLGVGELMARVRAVLRRRTTAQTRGTHQQVLHAGDLLIDFEHRRVTFMGEQVKLTPVEFALLERLASHPDQVLSHRELLTDVWGAEYSDQTEYLRISIGRLRRKLEHDPANPAHLLTEARVGYRFKPLT